jgi:hypothetical protein
MRDWNTSWAEGGGSRSARRSLGGCAARQSALPHGCVGAAAHGAPGCVRLPGRGRGGTAGGCASSRAPSRARAAAPRSRARAAGGSRARRQREGQPRREGRGRPDDEKHCVVCSCVQVDAVLSVAPSLISPDLAAVEECDLLGAGLDARVDVQELRVEPRHLGVEPAVVRHGHAHGLPRGGAVVSGRQLSRGHCPRSAQRWPGTLSSHGRH